MFSSILGTVVVPKQVIEEQNGEEEVHGAVKMGVRADGQDDQFHRIYLELSHLHNLIIG